MRAFYLAYEKCQTVSGKLSWSHYCELLSISDDNKRSFYEKEAVNSGWSVRELKRQIGSSLYERLLLSDGDANKEKAAVGADLCPVLLRYARERDRRSRECRSKPCL